MNNKPGFIDRAKLALKVYRDGLPSRNLPARVLKRAPYVFPAWRTELPQWSLIDYETYVTEGYEINSLLYEAIAYKARTSSSVPMRVYSGSRTNPEEIVDENLPLVNLMSNPNEFQTWNIFQQLLTVYLNISGNAYIFVDRPARGAPAQALYPIRPDRILIVPKKNTNKLLGFLYIPEGASQYDGIPILPEDMGHVKFPHPLDPNEGIGYGLSPMMPSAQSIDADNSLTGFLKQFFESGTMINVYLTYDQPMDEDVLRAAKKRFMELYGGYENWSEIAALDAGGKIEQFGMKFSEMEFAELDERSEARIIGPLGVPLQLLPSRLGMKASTYSNMGETRQIYWQDTLIPELGLFEGVLGNCLNYDDYWLRYDYSGVPALVDTLETRTAIWVKLVSWGIPKHEAAKIVGLPLRNLPDGDISYMPLNMVAVDASGNPTNPALTNAPQTKALISLAAEIKRASDLLEDQDVSVDIRGNRQSHPATEEIGANIG